MKGDEQAVKHVKTNAEERQCRISKSTEEISEFSRITFIEWRIKDATLSCNYRACDDLAAQVSEVRGHYEELNAELAKFQQKAKKAAMKGASKHTQPSRALIMWCV